MTTQGSLIAAADYNYLQSIVYNILGVGTGQSGYGQSTVSTPANTDDDITAAAIASLKIDILKCALHQGIDGLQDIVNLPSVSAGDDVTANQFNLFNLATTAITTNKFVLGNGQYSD